MLCNPIFVVTLVIIIILLQYNTHKRGIEHVGQESRLDSAIFNLQINKDGILFNKSQLIQDSIKFKNIEDKPSNIKKQLKNRGESLFSRGRESTFTSFNFT